MKRRIILLLAVAVLLFTLASCECKHKECSEVSCTTPSVCLRCEAVIEEAWGHTFDDATCTTPKTCSVCAATQGEALGHTWVEATCTTPKTCSVCNVTEGRALGHAWVEATCTAPQTCSVCNVTEGRALGHAWVDATCTMPKTCSVCGAIEGRALGHTWEDATCLMPKICSVCETTEGVALGHSYTETIILDATCCEDGKKEFSCDRCSDSYTETFTFIEYSANEVYEMSKNSVGEIITYDRSGAEHALGSGFVYSADGKIITNYHVIEDSYSAKITIAGVTYDIKQVLAYNKDKDLAILKIDATDLAAVSICNKEHAVGKTVFAFGSSKGLTATFSQGIITCADREVDGVSCVQHDSAISGGNSGGPLINSYGEVIGVNTWTIKDSQNLNLAVSVNELQNLTYGTPLTVSEFYEKECDIFTKVKNYIVERGVYDSKYNDYTVTLGYKYSSNGSKYTRKAAYDVDDNTIEFYLVIDNNYLVAITIDAIDGVYAWDYLDSADYYMKGTLYATTYTTNTYLGYYSNNIYSSSLRQSIRELASAMVTHLCSYLDEDFSSIGVTAEDLGFYYF